MSDVEQDAWLDVCLRDDFDDEERRERFPSSCQADDCREKATELVEDENGNRRVMCRSCATDALMDGCEVYAR